MTQLILSQTALAAGPDDDNQHNQCSDELVFQGLEPPPLNLLWKYSILNGGVRLRAIQRLVGL